MLKRISHIAISILLLITTTGLTISRHYCDESMLAAAHDASGESSCCDKTSECCQHEANTLRLESEFEATNCNADFSQLATIAPRPVVLAEEDLPVNVTQFSHFEGPLPPLTQELLSNIQVYIL